MACYGGCVSDGESQFHKGSYKGVIVRLFDKTEQILSFCVMLHSGFKGEVDESLPSPRLRKHFSVKPDTCSSSRFLYMCFAEACEAVSMKLKFKLMAILFPIRWCRKQKVRLQR